MITVAPSSDEEDEDFDDIRAQSAFRRDRAGREQTRNQSPSHPTDQERSDSEDESESELQKQVHALQLENAALKKQKQRAEIAAMDSQYKVHRMRRRTKGRAVLGKLVTNDILEPLDFVSQCARVYATLHFPWEETDVLDKLTIDPPNIDPDDPLQRYPSSESIVPVPLARQAEAHRLLIAHESAADFLGKATWVADEFHAKCLDQKSKFLGDASANVSYIFQDYNLSSEGLTKPEARKVNQGLKALGPKTPQDYYCPILFPPDHINDIEWIFKSHAVRACIRVTTCGRTSRLGDGPPLKISRAHIWGLKHVTPGLIAFAATTVIWLISGDIQFVPPSKKGFQPQYNYPEMFQKYEALLYRKRTNPIMIALFNELDQEIFGTTLAAPDTTADTADPDEHLEVLARNRGIEAAFDTPPASASGSHSSTLATAANLLPLGSTPSVSSGGVPTSSHTNDRTALPIEPTQPSSLSLSPPVPSLTSSGTQEPVQATGPPAQNRRAKASKKKPSTSNTVPSVDASTDIPGPRRSLRRTG